MEGLIQNLQANPLFAQFSGFWIYAIWGISLFVMANKEKEENAWWAFVPVLNLLLISRMGKVHWGWWLLALTGLLAPFVIGFYWWRVGMRRGGVGRPIWGALMVIPCFWYVSPIAMALGE